MQENPAQSLVATQARHRVPRFLCFLCVISGLVALTASGICFWAARGVFDDNARRGAVTAITVSLALIGLLALAGGLAELLARPVRQPEPTDEH